MFTFDQIKELVQLVAVHRLSGLEVSVQGFHLRIAGHGTLPAGTSLLAKETPGDRTLPDPLPQQAATPPTATSEAVPVVSATQSPVRVVTSPIVGTFYRAPSPEAPPFVEVGDRVRKGQVLCIVEAMKLMNEIESDVDGIVEKVHPQNAQPVEFGEPLFTIRPA